MDEVWALCLLPAASSILTLIAAKIVDRTIAQPARAPSGNAHALPGHPPERDRDGPVVGTLSALLVIPGVPLWRTVLASSAVIALVIGFAAQTTLELRRRASHRLHPAAPARDQVEVGQAKGEVEEIGLTYTVIRGEDGARYFVPNTKLASIPFETKPRGSTLHERGGG